MLARWQHPQPVPQCSPVPWPLSCPDLKRCGTHWQRQDCSTSLRPSCVPGSEQTGRTGLRQRGWPPWHAPNRARHPGRGTASCWTSSAQHACLSAWLSGLAARLTQRNPRTYCRLTAGMSLTHLAFEPPPVAKQQAQQTKCCKRPTHTSCSKQQYRSGSSCRVAQLALRVAT